MFSLGVLHTAIFCTNSLLFAFCFLDHHSQGRMDGAEDVSVANFKPDFAGPDNGGVSK
jgi:DNA-binding LacI/PurR family transcriptional regulator